MAPSFEAREHPSNQPESNVRPVQMYEAYPVNVDINPELPLITYMMLKKYPMPEGKERKPRVMEFVNDANDPTQQVAIMGQRFDCLVQFETWADTNQDASRIAEDFEHHDYIHLALQEAWCHGYMVRRAVHQ